MTLKLWDAATGEGLRTLRGHTGSVSSVAVSLDGARIGSGSEDKTLKLWDAATGEELRTLGGHSDMVLSVAFSPDGARLVSGNWDNTLKLRDAATGQELRTLEGHTEWASSVAFSPDGARIYSQTANGEEFVWDTLTGIRLETETWQNLDMKKKVTDDGRWLVTSSGDDVLLVDRENKNQPYEKAFRAFKAKPNPQWHHEQAAIAETENDWYAALFHRSWVMKENPESASSWDNLHAAHEKWLGSHEDGEPAPLPLIVRQMLELPRGGNATDEE
jgi:WD domain, G-beta repeat